MDWRQKVASLNKLLLALDTGPQSELLIKRVCQLYSHAVKQLEVVHVVRQGLHDAQLLQMDSCSSVHPPRIDDYLAIKIREMLRRNGLNVSSDKIHLVRGEPAYEIKKLAKMLAVDLVIIGSHCPENNWVSLPGATTNCVIQGVSSDVMAVKI
ncbi:MAG: universal stress protein A [Pseudohongiellaceae bacterium]